MGCGLQGLSPANGVLIGGRSRTIKRLAISDVIEIRYAGEISYESRLATLDELERIAGTTPLSRLLVNYTAAWPAPEPQTDSIRIFGSRLANLSLSAGARIALLNAPKDVESGTRTSASIAGYQF